MNTRTERCWLIALMIVALAYGAAYALLVPLWQSPDEPMLFEYAALTVQLRRIPTPADRSPPVESRIVDSLARNGFWRYADGARPGPPPRTMDEAQARFWMPRQVGGDPPAYFAASALPLRLAAAWSVDQQALLLRLLNAALLPAIVLCAFGAARELSPAQTNDTASIIPIAVAALVALQPMATAIGASLGNDGLANLLGGASCWVWLRIVGRGARPRRLVLALALLALGLLTKRTMLPYLALPIAAGAAWLARWARQAIDHVSARTGGALGWVHRATPFQTVMGAATITTIALTLWVANQLDWGTAWGWYWYNTHQPSSRVWSAGESQMALRLAAGQMAVQPLPVAALDHIRDHQMRFGVRVWSEGAAGGRLVVLNGSHRYEIPFITRGSAARLEISVPIVDRQHLVAIGIASDSGTVYAADAWADSGGLSLMENQSLALPGVRPGSPLLSALGYLRVPDILWTVQHGLLGHRLPAGWGALLFASFWGQFGWMNIPFVLESGWLWVLAALCLVGALGVPFALRRAPPRERRQLWLLMLLCSVAVLLPVVNAYAMPVNQSLQQGRYLFPALAPLAILLALGLSALLRAGWRRRWLGAWVAFWAVFAASALFHVVAHYA